MKLIANYIGAKLFLVCSLAPTSSGEDKKEGVFKI